MDSKAELSERICDTGRLLYERGLSAGPEGNLSCRLSEEHVLCTSTMICKGRMKPADLCVVDLAGRKIDGTASPTSEILLHLEIYKNDPKVRAVVHCHPPHATAFAVSGTPPPRGVLAEAEYYLGDVPMVDYHLPGTAEFARLIVPHLTGHRCAILRNHGAVSWGVDIEKARWWMEVLESYCRVLILARSLGDYRCLDQSQVAELRRSAALLP